MSSNDYENYHEWKGWSDLFSFNSNDARYFSRELRTDSFQGKKVLEFGFGQGAFLSWARSNGAQVVGVEENQYLCQEAISAGYSIESGGYDALKSKYSNYFDVVVAFDVIEHMTYEEVKDFFDMLENCTNDNALICLRFPNGASPFGLIPQNSDPTHRTSISLSFLQPVLHHTPFELVYYGRPASPFPAASGKYIVSILRRAVSALLGCVFNFAYSQKNCWAPVVTLVLKKK